MSCHKTLPRTDILVETLGGCLICPAGGSSTRVGGADRLQAAAQLRAARPSPRPEWDLRSRSRSQEERPSLWEAQQLTVGEGNGRKLNRNRAGAGSVCLDGAPCAFAPGLVPFCYLFHEHPGRSFSLSLGPGVPRRWILFFYSNMVVFIRGILFCGSIYDILQNIYL